MAGAWACVEAARNGGGQARVGLWLRRDDRAFEVGSLAPDKVAAVCALPGLLSVRGGQATFTARDDATLSDDLARANHMLREKGEVQGWRDELFSIYEPSSLRRLGAMERAATRFWGTLTLGAHCNGYVAGDDGRPTHLWIGQRAANKSVDPSAFDNLIGAGVGDRQTPAAALVREAWEEAGLKPGALHQLVPGRAIQMLRAIPEGLQFERLFSYDLRLPLGVVPRNQDGEVQGFQLLPTHEALSLARNGAMTVDASLVTLDFALRHQLLDAAEASSLSARAGGLWSGASPMARV